MQSPALPRNLLLSELPPADLERLRPHLGLVRLPLGAVLHESGSHMREVYFPVSSLVSLLYILADGGTAEIALVGNDGCVGIAVLLGGVTTPSRAVVQVAGHAYRIKSAIMLDEFHRSSAIQSTLLRYVQALITQMSQTAVCNRHHTVEQQLCRWLLLSLDRVPSNEIRMTQELISNMLGVRRAGITQAARSLQEAGLIEYRRPDRGPRSRQAAGARLRMLCGGQEGSGPPVPERVPGRAGPPCMTRTNPVVLRRQGLRARLCPVANRLARGAFAKTRPYIH